jgi:hypothetical protein
MSRITFRLLIYFIFLIKKRKKENYKKESGSETRMATLGSKEMQLK